MTPKVLTALRDLVEADLTDSSNGTWTTGELDRAIRKAVHRYSEVRPAKAIATIAAAASREYSTAALTGMIDIERVWWPYKAADPVYPPKWVDFELWPSGTLFLKSDARPAVGDDPMRVFYTKLHTINGLDSETTGTLPDEDEEVIILGATGYAAVQRARYVVDTVNPSAQTPELWSQWGQGRLSHFEQELRRIAAREVRRTDGRIAIQWPDLDTFSDLRDSPENL